ncbi:MAG: STAS domain-containing protein [Acidobacteriota bacterium]
MVKCNFDVATETVTCTFEGRMDAHATAADDPVIRRVLAGSSKVEPADAPFVPPEPGPPRPARVIFDLKDVDFVSSGFFKMCIAIAKEMGEGRFAVQNTRPLVEKAFKVAGIDGLFEVG